VARSNSFIAAVTELDRLPVSVGVLELDGTIVRVNPAGTEMLGRPVEEIIGRKAWEFAPGAEHIWDEVIATARRVGVFRGEIAVATTQGARNVRYSAALRVHEGETVVVVLAIELATEPDNVRLLDLESKQRLEALGLVAGGIAHDFNNQLVSVLAEASAAREDAMLGDAGRDSLRRIEAAAHRMAQLTRQLLAYAGRGRFVNTIDVARVAPDARHAALSYLWARARISELSDFYAEDAHRQDIIDLGLKYNLLTRFTSFIAVQQIVRSAGSAVDVDQAVPLPVGVSENAVGMEVGPEPELVFLLVAIAMFVGWRCYRMRTQARAA